MTALPASAAFAAASPALRARLLAFNLLPSRQLHPARIPAWQSELQALGDIAQQPALQRVLHRRWSARLLAALGIASAPVTDLSHPALPLALAEPEVLQRLVRDAGVLLLGSHLRRCVLRAQVLAIRAAFGGEALHWAYHAAQSWHPGLSDCSAWLGGTAPADYVRAADVLGTGLVAQSWQDAPAGLQRRADCRLAPEADDPALRAASGLDAAQARALCLQLLDRLEAA